MANELSGITDAIQKTAEAFAKAITTVGKALQDASGLANVSDRERLVENWIRVARLSKDGVIVALEQGFDMWERQVRRLAAQGSKVQPQPAKPEPPPANPMEAWAENWRKAIESFTAGASWSDEARRQAEAVQKALADGVRSWQKLWQPDRK